MPYKYLHSLEELGFYLILRKVCIIGSLYRKALNEMKTQSVLLTWEGAIRKHEHTVELWLLYIVLRATLTIFLKIFFIILEVINPVPVTVLMVSTA